MSYEAVRSDTVLVNAHITELEDLRQQFSREYAQVMGALTDLRNQYTFLEKEHLKLKKLVLDSENVEPKLSQRFARMEDRVNALQDELGARRSGAPVDVVALLEHLILHLKRENP